MTGTKPFCYRYPRPMVTVDAVVFRSTKARLEVLVVERGKDPFAGALALPGGFVEMDEDLPDAAKRELFEETGLKHVALTQLAAFGKPGRDPRGRNISVVFVGTVKAHRSSVKGGDDAARALWIPARRPGALAFDHNEILKCALRWLAS
jgi:8-oxo-dGTP diphosphatase